MRFLKTFSAAALALCLGVAPARAEFTVADNFVPLRYSASADQYAFSVTWPFEANADLVVRTSTDGVAWTTKVLTTDYTVTGAATTNGGTVTFVAAHCDGTLLGCDEGTIVIIERDDGVDRTSDFTTITPTGLNLHLDRMTLHAQQTEDIARNRAVQVPIDNDYSGDGFSPVLPQANTDVSGHAVVVEEPEADGFEYSRKSLDDWGCLECPGDDPDDGICDGGANDGDACTTDADCPGGECDHGTCDGGANDGDTCEVDADCPDGECDPGICVGGANDGEPCESNADCPDGTCDGDGVDSLHDCDYISTDADGKLVCSQGTCPDACGGGEGGCLDCGDTGLCVSGENDGLVCTTDADCPGGLCVMVDDVCFGGTGDGDACTDDADCPEGGRCRPNDNQCWDGTTLGEECTLDADCAGGWCIDPGDDVCTETACPDGDGTDNITMCAAGTSEEYEECTTNTDCTGGDCVSYCASCGSYCRSTALDCGGECACGAVNVCADGVSEGEACVDDTDCALSFCYPEFTDEVCQTATGGGDHDACTDDADCPTGETCRPFDASAVRGAGSSTDNAVTRWDGVTGRFIQDSDVTLGDSRGMGYLSSLGFAGETIPPVINFIMPREADQDGLKAWAWYFLPPKNPHYVGTDGRSANSKKLLTVTGPGVGDPLFLSHMEWDEMTYPIHVFAPGVSTNDQLILRTYFTEDVICLDEFAGSEVWNATTFTASKVYNIQKNGSTVGTATFDTDAGPNEAVLTTSGAAEITFAAGDYLDIDAPASADATGANLSFTLNCLREID